MSCKINISPIGVVRNRFNRLSRRVHLRAKRSRIILFPCFAGGLYRIKEDKYLEVIFYFHRSKGYRLICETPHWGTRGVFACRSPYRPVPLGLTKVRLISVHKNQLVVEGLDAVNGTPVLDIKPFITYSRPKKGDRPSWKKKKTRGKG